MKTIFSKIGKLYQMNAVKRAVIIWVLFQLILWAAFAAAYGVNFEAWNHEITPERSQQPAESIAAAALFILVSNLILFIIIAAGNLFVRFAAVTPGLLILLIQGIIIGSTAGSNAFEFPFARVLDANIQFLKVGLWETTAYALICAVTLTKSLNIAETFPPRQWSETRKLKELSFDLSEKLLIALSIAMLIGAAAVEAILIAA
jgi:hypothetical protein